ncbi:MAG: F0F1 ATP synthase subunit A, partial [Salinibacterium sp.]
MIPATLVSLLPLADGDGSDGGFHGPSIDEFFPDAILFAGTPFELNRILLIRLIAVAVVLFILWMGTRNLRVIPTRGQAAIEYAIDFVRKGIVIDTLGEK